MLDESQHTGICHFPQLLGAVPLMGSSSMPQYKTGVGSNLLDMPPALFLDPQNALDFGILKALISPALKKPPHSV